MTKIDRFTMIQRLTYTLKPLASVLIMFGLTTQLAQAELIIHNESAKTEAVREAAKVSNATTLPSLSGSALGVAASEASILKLMQVMHIDEQIDTIIQSQTMAAEILKQQSQLPAGKDEALTKRQRELRDQIQGLLGQYSQVLSGGIETATDKETLKRAYIDAAKAYYTQNEVDALIGFYDTPTGQSILEKQPQVTSAFLQQALPKDMSKTQQQLGELLPKMKQIFKDIF
ncbi:MAG: DUF2059 domain-containing protein [Psychrobacter sp.]|nr:DUF2059 domain-containing protein [Psychrobacter sp.]